MQRCHGLWKVKNDIFIKLCKKIGFPHGNPYSKKLNQRVNLSVKQNIKFIVGDSGETKLMSHKTAKRCSTSLLIQKLQMKISVSSQHILAGMDAMQKIASTKQRQEYGAVDTSSWPKMQNDQIIELAKRFVQIFLFDVMKSPEQTFQPT